MAIEAAHYEETRQALTIDPIVIAMAAGLPDDQLDEMVHESGTPRSGFMNAANAEYRKRGGTGGGHIGAVAEALLRIKGR